MNDCSAYLHRTSWFHKLPVSTIVKYFFLLAVAVSSFSSVFWFHYFGLEGYTVINGVESFRPVKTDYPFCSDFFYIFDIVAMFANILGLFAYTVTSLIKRSKKDLVACVLWFTMLIVIYNAYYIVYETFSSVHLE